MKAIQEAQQAKREIAARLRQELVEFTERTGLLVSNVNVSAIETTRMSDEYPRYGDYRVTLDIEV